MDLSVRQSSTAAAIIASNQGAPLAAKLHAIREAVKENQQEQQLEPLQQPQQQGQQQQQQQDQQQHVGAWVPLSSVPGLLHPMTGPMRGIGALPVACVAMDEWMRIHSSIATQPPVQTVAGTVSAADEGAAFREQLGHELLPRSSVGGVWV